MDNDIAKMTGQAGGQGLAYRLNEVKMSGDDGSFTLRELLGEKGADGKYPVKDLGKTVDGVILKMRWRLSKYEEGKPSITTSEFDNKNTDRVVIYSSGEKGTAVELKEKYQLPSQRVLYVWLKEWAEVVRIIVKSSALSGEKNPGHELGLFEYVDDHNAAGTMLHEYLTRFEGVYREDEKNKRKSYYAMSFSRGEALSEKDAALMVERLKDIHAKTTEAAAAFADTWQNPEETTATKPIETQEINPDDIPF